MKKAIKYGLLLFLVLCLVAVRVFIEPLLYDPLIEFFKSDYLHNPIPDLYLGLYIANLSVRFFINSLISLLIIFVVFNNKNTVLFSGKVYLFSYLFLIISFFLIVEYKLIDGYLTVFYLRRFLIHPIILLLLIPAYYYQELVSEKRKP
jgi:exosortase F-associated protein